MRASDIASVIEEFAPIYIQESWDNAGFCIGSPQQEIRAVLLAFDCTVSVVEEAIEVGANMIITHHPLIFGGVKKISPDNNLGKIITLAIKNDIVIYSAHTNIDKVIGGVSGQMAERLSLKNVEILEKSENGEVGLGVVGELQSPLTGEEFLKKLKEVFSLKYLRASDIPQNKISRVALCGGSGKSLIPKALSSGAQAYVTGDLSYHDFFCETEDFMIVDIGHYESEIDIVGTIFSLLTEKIPTFAVRITKQDNNPVYYY